MSRVFCGKCRHYRFGEYNDTCEAKNNLTLCFNHIWAYYDNKLTPEVKNKNNDCSDYKRDWWRFWEK